MRNIFVFLFTLSVFQAYAQTGTEKLDLSDMFYIKQEAGQGKITIHQDERLHAIFDEQIKSNGRKSTTSGWRLQLYFGSGHDAREQAQTIRQDFLESFPDVKAYLVHESPFFKVRVGDFRTRVDAVRFRKKIEKYYSSSWIIKDQVDYNQF